VTDKLRRLGFDVDVQTDLSRDAMRAAFKRLGDRLRMAGRGSTGMFYYAGHGLEEQGENFLIPVDAAIHTAGDIRDQAVSTNEVVKAMRDSPDAVNIVILDACRNTPAFLALPNGDRGFAITYGPTGSFIEYSTAPGHLASDGVGKNSPFAAAFAAEVTRPGEEINEIFNGVRRLVVSETQNSQTPWTGSSMIEDFYFLPAAGASSTPTVAQAEAPVSFDRSTAGVRALGGNATHADVLQWLDDATQSNIVTVAASKAELHMGDSIRFRVSSHADGWVSLFEIDPKGKVVRLYPLSYDEAKTYIHAGESKDIPGRVRIEPPLGNEIIIAFVTKTPLVRNGTSTLCESMPAGDSCFQFYDRVRDLSKQWMLVDPQTGVGDWAVGAAHYVTTDR
jgi:uncharacterized caspase-like protein